MGNDAVEVEPYSGGVDCWVDLVRRPDTPPAVVRSAKVERLETRYEGLVDFGVVLERELIVSRLLRTAGVPTPAVLAWHRTSDPDTEPSWMLLEYVPHSPLDTLTVPMQHSLGRLARRIHSITPREPDLHDLAPPRPWNDWMLDRILQRIRAARRYMSVPATDTLARRLGAILKDRSDRARSLIHLDLRAPNLAMDGGEIIAVFDLSNAIVGDPYLELGRLRGCDLLTPAFLAGYAEDPGELAKKKLLLDAYEIDLAALLVVVSREEFDDEALHSRMVVRTTELIERVLAATGID